MRVYILNIFFYIYLIGINKEPKEKGGSWWFWTPQEAGVFPVFYIYKYIIGIYKKSLHRENSSPKLKDELKIKNIVF